MFGNEVDIGSTPQEMQKHTQFSLSSKSSGSLEVRRVCYNEGSKGGFSLGFGLGVSSSLGIGPFQASSIIWFSRPISNPYQSPKIKYVNYFIYELKIVILNRFNWYIFTEIKL